MQTWIEQVSGQTMRTCRMMPIAQQAVIKAFGIAEKD